MCKGLRTTEDIANKGYTFVDEWVHMATAHSTATYVRCIDINAVQTTYDKKRAYVYTIGGNGYEVMFNADEFWFELRRHVEKLRRGVK